MSKTKQTKIFGFTISFIGILTFLPLVVPSVFYLHVLVQASIFVVLAFCTRLLWNCGLLLACQAGFLALGAYTSALLTMKWGLSTWFTMPIAGLLTGAICLVIGYPFLRMKGLYFSVATLSLSEVIRLGFSRWKTVTGGWTGLTNIPGLSPFFGIQFGSIVSCYYFGLALTVFIGIIFYRLEHSQFGENLFAIRDSDILTKSVGLNTTKHLMLAFVITGFSGGVVGGFYAHFMSCISPMSFTFSLSVSIIAYCVVGGLRSYAGPIVGVVFLTGISDIAFPGLGIYKSMAFGIFMIISVLFLPGGLIDLLLQVRSTMGRLATRGEGN